jgi:hypothetical protein
VCLNLLLHLYIWLGTCDLTTKNKDGTISLATQHSETSKNVFEELKKFKEGVEDTSRLEERLQMCIYKFDELLIISIEFILF